jgi:hypothetical protein
VPEDDSFVLKETEPTGYLARNAELVLDHFGMGSLFWPTLEDLANTYDGLETRQRAGQIIEKYYSRNKPEDPLPAAAAAAEILERRSFWLESEFLAEVKNANLTQGIEIAKPFLVYLTTQGLAGDYDVYQPDLNVATRQNYRDHDDRVILTSSRKKRLEKIFRTARRIVGPNGLCRLAHVENAGSNSDLEALRFLIQLHKDAWSTERDGAFWYAFDDRDNRLVNSAEKIFSVVKKCEAHYLAVLLSNSLRSRTSRFKEYPDNTLVQEWISHSDHFRVVSNHVALKGEATSVTEIEKDVIDIMRGQGKMTSPEISYALRERGHGDAYIRQQIFNSALVYADRSGGRENYHFTLVTDLSLRAAEDQKPCL